MYSNCSHVDIDVADTNGEYNDNDGVVAKNNDSVRNNKNDSDNFTTNNRSHGSD